ncbi:MAG: hypothetical protein ACI9T9_000891, partial [Oleiphilaceae bacterium]
SLFEGSIQQSEENIMNSHEKLTFARHYAKYERLLVLQGFSKATIDSYTRGIWRLADWCDKCPDNLKKSRL